MPADVFARNVVRQSLKKSPPADCYIGPYSTSAWMLWFVPVWFRVCVPFSFAFAYSYLRHLPNSINMKTNSSIPLEYVLVLHIRIRPNETLQL
jgi:hypothetical protein